MEENNKFNIILIIMFILIMFGILLNFKLINQDLVQEEFCKQENNLTYSYFNKTTKEITQKVSNIPIYVDCDKNNSSKPYS